MGICFGTVVWLDPTGAVIRFDNGVELRMLTADLARLNTSDLQTGARVRGDLEGNTLRSLVVLPGQASPAPQDASGISLGLAQRAAHGGCRALENSSVGEQKRGVVTQVGPYHINVMDQNGEHYVLMRHRQPHQDFAEGDGVLFHAGEDHKVLEIALLEMPLEGVGGDNPCGSLLAELEKHIGRPAIKQLVRHLCDERRLEWYWITPGRAARRSQPRELLSPSVWAAIRHAEESFEQFYLHQALALDALRDGRHVLVLTPTASGKTYCYNPAVFQMLSSNPSVRALYVFPLNALMEDQVAKLKQMAAGFGESGLQIDIARLVGGLTEEERRGIEDAPPHLLATNPEMLCWMLGRNAYGGWRDFFRRLRFVVLDEVHAYRSLLGLHMAGLVRQLHLVCQRCGNPGPQFVLSSATVGAPIQLATRLTSLPEESFVVIGEQLDGSQQPPRHWMKLKALTDGNATVHDLHLQQAALTLVDALTVPDELLNVILFAKSIRDVRFIHRAVEHLLEERRHPELKRRVRSYASALFDSLQEKQEVYEALRRGDLRAVVSTNALEAGIDIGKLDICIIAGFPFTVMRTRQMAGRAGRRQEGAVIFIPDPMHPVDKFYADQPRRLLTLPPEQFVIDHENPYIARKHVVACAANLAGGVRYQELRVFGRHLDRMLQEAIAHGVLDQVNADTYTARRRVADQTVWSIGNMRSAEQNPYAICKAAPDRWLRCRQPSCLNRSQQLEGRPTRCDCLVQLIDRQYVYREAHPGAVFEDRDQNLYQVCDFDDERKTVRVASLPEGDQRRTFANEIVEVAILNERGRRAMRGGASLVWGDVRVTRSYSDYFEYELIPRRRCPHCRRDYDITESRCPICEVSTRPYLASSKPQSRDFPDPYAATTYSIELDTIACWLCLPAELDAPIGVASRCWLAGPQNRVTQFLNTTPPFRDVADLVRVVGLAPEPARHVLDYFRRGHRVLSRAAKRKEHLAIYPAFYGQCLRYYLRKNLIEDEALSVFARVTGYPVLSDQDHVCKNCTASVLLPAAHTLEHMVSLRYPTVALGDFQDLSSVTRMFHPQTKSTTVFWYDNYEGGIGAAEKVFEHFEVLLDRVLANMECECSSDAGCPLCTQTAICDRGNDALSKAAARALIHQLLGLPDFIPDVPDYWIKQQVEKLEKTAVVAQRASRVAAGATDKQQPEPDAFVVLRVQPHVHDSVLQKALEVRAEEIATEMPPVGVKDLHDAYRRAVAAPRPREWCFPPQWSPYEVLHVRPEASKRLTRSAYKTIVRHIHPDVNREPWAHEAMQRVNAAWEQIQQSWYQATPD